MRAEMDFCEASYQGGPRLDKLASEVIRACRVMARRLIQDVLRLEILLSLRQCILLHRSESADIETVVTQRFVASHDSQDCLTHLRDLIAASL